MNCYHLLADETSDVVLSALARGKKDMLESFLGKPQGQGEPVHCTRRRLEAADGHRSLEMLQLMTAGVVPSIDDSVLDENDGQERKRGKKGKQKATEKKKRSESEVIEIRSSSEPGEWTLHFDCTATDLSCHRLAELGPRYPSAKGRRWEASRASEGEPRAR